MLLNGLIRQSLATSIIKGFIMSRGKEYAIGQTYFICPPIVMTSSALKISLQIYFNGPLSSSFSSVSLLLLPWSCDLQRFSLGFPGHGERHVMGKPDVGESVSVPK